MQRGKNPVTWTRGKKLLQAVERVRINRVGLTDVGEAKSGSVSHSLNFVVCPVRTFPDLTVRMTHPTGKHVSQNINKPRLQLAE